MPKRGRRRRLEAELRRRHPELGDVGEVIASGRVLVDGMPGTNPDTRVSEHASIVIRDEKPLRGYVKLQAALEAFSVDATGAVALDAGASAGGFTKALLDAGAAKVYAVEIGYGQLLGSLRQDPRVVNLERTNVASLTPELVPDTLDLVTLDLGYLALAEGVPQLNGLSIRAGADLIGLVKPMLELGLGELPADDALVAQARDRAAAGIAAAGWAVVAASPSPIPGSRGATELFLHARRAGPSGSAPR